MWCARDRFIGSLPDRPRRRISISISLVVLLVVFEATSARGQRGLSEEKPTAASGLSAEHMARSSHPLSAEVERARKLLEEGQTEQAIPLLRQAIRENDQDGDAHLLLGVALSTVPKRTEALEELQKAVTLEPGSAVAYFSFGNAQARFANLDAAQAAYEKAVQLDPTFVQARISLALILAQQRQLDAAKENLEKAIALLGERPAAAYPHYLLGRVLFEQNHPHEALKHLNAASRLRPGYEEAYFTTGMVEKYLHDDHAAADALQKAAQLSPGDAQVEFELGSALYRLGKPLEAIGPLQKTVELKPDDRQARFQLCLSLQRAGRDQDAAICQQKMRALIGRENAVMQSSSAKEHNNRGVMLEKSGDLQGAVANYKAAVTLDPTQSVFRRNFALALCRQGHWEEGIAELRKVLKQDPEDTEATRALYIALDHVKGVSGSAPATAAGSRSGPP